MNVAIITGASSGMGREMVRQLDKIYAGGIDEFWIIARREDRLIELSKEINHTARIFNCDLTEEKSLAELELSLNLLNPNVKLLVNASGYGILGEFAYADEQDTAGMVRLNCESLTTVTRIVLGYMHRGGRIIMFASSAAFVPQPDFAVYAATKSYVLSLSRALNAELSRKGISVTAVCPGPVNTEFFNIAEKGSSNYNFKKYFMAKEQDEVKKAIMDAYKRRELSVFSLPMQAFMVIAKIVPHKLVLMIMKYLK